MTVSYQTVIISISHGITAVIAAALALLVLWQAPRLRSNRVFALMMTFLSAHSVLNVAGRFFQQLAIEPTGTYRVILTLYLGFIALLFPFVAEYAHLRNRLIRAILIYDLIISLFAAYAINTGQIFRDLYPLADGGFNAVYGRLFPPVMLAFLIYLIATTAVLYRSRESRAHRMWPALTLILAGVLSLAARPIVPLPLNSICLAAASLWMGYVILKDQLFDPLAELNRDLSAANMQLAESNLLTNQFIANMSHELRTPLNSVIGYTELVLDGIYGPLSEQQHDRLERVVRNGQILLGLINDVLDLSKIQAGRMMLNRTVLETTDLLDSVLAAIEPMAHEKSLAVYRDYDHAVPLYADETRTRQIFMNLLSNAVKFTDAGSVTIHVDARPADGMAHFAVQDTGIGIPRDKQALIFEEFRQVDGSSTRRHQGAGLGLAITRHLVEMHGGHIWLESEPDCGSTFHFTLPIAETSEPDRVLASPPAPPGVHRANGAPAVLVIDDDWAARDILQTLARQAGYLVTIYGSDEEDFSWPADRVPVMILAGDVLASEKGWQTLAALRKIWPTTMPPLTAVGMVNGIARAALLQIADVVPIPVLGHDLLPAVQHATNGTAPGEPVLVVENDAAVRAQAEAILTGVGYRVELAPDGGAACDWLSAHRASLIVLNIVLPGITGFDVLRFIRDNQQQAQVPIVVMTGSASLEQQALQRSRYLALLETGEPVQELLQAQIKESH